MKQTLIILTIIFIVGCSDRQTKTISSDKILDSLNKISKVFKEDSTQFHSSCIDSTVSTENYYKNLSYENNYKLKFIERFSNGIYVDHYWVVEVFDKKTNNKNDSISQLVGELNFNAHKSKNVKSLITGKIKNKLSLYKDYGDFVVADFNFDTLEDFAIENDMGGSRGSHYSFFIQQRNKKFILDKFLTDTMDYFPQEFIKNSNILITSGPCGAYWRCEEKYKLDKKTNKWSLISFKEIDLRNK